MTTVISESQPSFGIEPPGYRLPADTRLGRVRLQVADLSRSLSFYEGILGLAEQERSGGTAVLGATGDGTPLVELVERAGVRAVPRRGLLGLYHVALLLPERAALARFLWHLAEQGVRAGMSDHRVSEAIYLTDPDGLGIEVYADRPRSAWRYTHGQIAMATNPLDVDGLLRVAGGVPWSGAPAGTVVGHVHLHVGDLGRATAFYHEALGFDQVVWSYPGALFLSAGGYHHHLGMNTWAGAVPSAGAEDARLLEWTLVLPGAEDAGGAVRSLEAAGYALTHGARGWLAVDPWGTPLRLATSG